MRRIIGDVRDTWVFPILSNRCEAWALELEQRLDNIGATNPCIQSIEVQVFDLAKTPRNGWAMLFSPCHTIVKITLCDGNFFYADVGAWGGGDHLFFGGDIPWEYGVHPLY